MKHKDKFPLGLDKVEDFTAGGGKKEESLLEENEWSAIDCVRELVPEASKMFNGVFGEDELVVEKGGVRIPEDAAMKNVLYRIAQIGLAAMMAPTWHCGGQNKHDKVEHQKALADIVEKFQSSMN